MGVSFLNRLSTETKKAWRNEFRQASLPVEQCFLALLFQFHIKALSALARLRLFNVLFSTPRRLEIIHDLELVLLV